MRPLCSEGQESARDLFDHAIGTDEGVIERIHNHRQQG
jgi:hypothetical protein